MNKTAAMSAAEERIGKPLEMALVDLYAEHQDWTPVAERLGVSRQTVYTWRRILGIGAGDATTMLQSGETVPEARPTECSKEGKIQCPYCGMCQSVRLTCGYCAGAFAV